jgi:hypothetical protein
MSQGEMCCSFCGKNRDQVRNLMAGPGVFVCNECVQACVHIMFDGKSVPDLNQSFFDNNGGVALSFLGGDMPLGDFFKRPDVDVETLTLAGFIKMIVLIRKVESRRKDSGELDDLN